LVNTGPDSVRISASILDVRKGAPLGEVQIKGDERRMDALSDSLTVGLLRAVGAVRPIGATRSVRFSSTTVPALKAFLTGEQLLRAAFGVAPTAFRIAWQGLHDAGFQ
jgi:hypothetical protein